MADLHEALEHADDADLFYVSDASPGITRRRRGKGFSYHRPDGSLIKARKEIDRIKAIAVPPAWTDVWISPLPDGHVLATGRDAKGRKQYRYHPRWRDVRDETKYHRLVPFGECLPDLRERLRSDMRKRGLPREKVLAAVVHLLDETLIRIGNAEYAANNEAYGLSTLQDDHAEIEGSRIRFEFSGKSGNEWAVSLRDRRLARIVKASQDLPGEELFQYLDEDGNVVDVGSGDVNAYLCDVTGDRFSAKDFRTWGGTVYAAEALAGMGEPDTKKEAEKNVIAAIDAAAERLNNTRSIARSSYVHPEIPEAYKDGQLLDLWDTVDAPDEGLRHEEAVVLEVLRKRA